MFYEGVIVGVILGVALGIVLSGIMMSGKIEEYERRLHGTENRNRK